ncbi:HNH endonuclease [Streptomyces cyaneofuscatus]|uniref:HNH endonuclease signature motif containing protein n=1 Tax=Streptomyces cyaneofuscatus TaxID=66883 RepID=UPI00387092D9|nr:HNH endonuclease [Streptomyces cyaneofuscatus]
MTQRQRYTRERLVEAAECCSDIDEVVAFLGTRPYAKLDRHLLRRFAHFGIDVSHFRHCGSHTAASRPSRDALREAVAASRSVAELLRRLGRPANGHQRKLLRQWIAEDSLSTSHFLGQAHQRGRPGPTPARRPEEVLVKHAGSHRTRTVLLRRALRETGIAEACDACGTEPVWRGSPITLEIDHINGDWSDDRAENLRLLCPNCHAVTTTWCRGGARRVARQGTLTQAGPPRPVR